jgi:peptidoglycan/xylan/chitin deacetylase (PgdA/CDA1 family)
MRAPRLESIILCRLGEKPTQLNPPASDSVAETRPVEVERLHLDSLHDADLDQLRAFHPALGIVIGAAEVPPSFHCLPSLGCVRVHAGIIRGSAGGRTEAVGATVLRLGGEASGAANEVIASATAPIAPVDTLADVEARAEELGQLLLGRVLENLDAGSILGRTETPWERDAQLVTVNARDLRVRLASALHQLGRAARPWQVVKSLAALVILTVIAPARNLLRTLLRRHPVRLFTFHRVSSLCRDGMTVSPDVFRQQLRYIARTHRLVPLGTCLDMARSGAKLVRPVAAITFDDGYRSVYVNAFPIMKREGTVAACFVSTDLVGTSQRFAHDASLPVVDLLEIMDWKELETLRAAGWEIGGHTATHKRLSQCDEAVLTEELLRPLAQLEQRLGIERPTMAYPFGGRGDMTATAVDLARRAGYSACLSDFGGENYPQCDLFDLKRIELGGDHPTLAWKTRVHGLDVGGVRWPQLQLRRIVRAWQGAPPVNA